MSTTLDMAELEQLPKPEQQSEERASAGVAEVRASRLPWLLRVLQSAMLIAH